MSEVTQAPLGRRERKKLQTRERILDEASALISEQGLAATTVDQIAERADISPATFFNYFPNKATLVGALVARLVDLWGSVVDEARAVEASAIDTVAALFQFTADFTHNQHRLLRDLIVEATRVPDDGPSGLARMRNYFRDDLADGQARGEVRDDQDPAALADCVLGLYVSVLVFWTTETDYPIVERLQAATAMAIELISPVPAGVAEPAR